nr:EAL domain-containing protein [Alkaliphilus flagellatus]
MELETANKELLLHQQKINNLAYYDSVTMLPNRLFLVETLNKYIENASIENSRFAVLHLDLDRFKHINDTLGHNTGDKVLKLVGKRIEKLMEKEDFFARIGGDEFIILKGHINNDAETIDMANAIIEEFNRPFEISGYQLFLTTSIGISIYPYGGENSNDLIKNSDISMYVAKGNGGNCYYVYNKALSEKQMENLILINELRQALENNELIMFYQPIIDTVKGQVVGMEALLRWNKPEQGFISPDKFIPLAEETGLIIPIGEWVLKSVCIQNKRWIDRGYNAKRVFVNISARQFQQKDFFEKIITILNETGLDPNYLGLEITETTVVQDIKYTIEILNKLKDIGVSISIDDFGTGYSSFNYLKDMKVDGLKIDRSFIGETNNNCRKRAIAKTIILLAHQLNLTVTAEGVETKEQLEFLKENDCDYVQGYYYSKPISADEFEKFLD